MPRSILNSVQIGVDICCVSRIRELFNTTTPSIVAKRDFNSKESINETLFDSKTNTPIYSQSNNEDIKCRPTQQRRFFSRLFTPYEELFYQLTKPHIFRNNIRDPQLTLNDYKFIAGRFSAKEAIIKAIRNRRLSFHDIIVLPRHVELPDVKVNMSFVNPPRSEPPRAVVLAPQQKIKTSIVSKVIGSEYNLSREQRALNFGITLEEYIEDMRRWEEGDEVQLNISHDGDYAVSVCLASTSIC